jgi:AAA15 family ATPase/GTPase
MSKGKGFFNIYPYKYKNDLKYFDPARANPYNLGSAYQLDMPNGKNLPQVIANAPKLAMKLGSYFEEYGLQFMLDKVENKLFVVKAEENTFIKFNYHSIADTLKRRIFYYVAMATNKNKVLLFEEPEAHFFPPYILDLTQQIVDDVTNQFFIATHSPYLLEKIIEHTSFTDLNIVVCDYQNHETKIKILREKEIEHLLNMGESVFFNLDYFFEE